MTFILNKDLSSIITMNLQPTKRMQKEMMDL